MNTTVKMSFPSIEEAEYQRFLGEFYNGMKYRGMRLGQAFYNHFKLDKIDDQASLQNINEKSGDVAIALIRQLFHFS